MPRNRSTIVQYDQRLNQILALLIAGKRVSEIKRVVKHEWGCVSGRACERYVSRARAILRKEYDQTREDACARALAWYETILTDESLDPHARLKARERMDSLLGLDAPLRVDASVTHAVDPDLLAAARALAKERALPPAQNVIELPAETAERKEEKA